MNNEYINDTSIERIVIDYIAGMTDDFFISEYKLLVKPNVGIWLDIHWQI